MSNLNLKELKNKIEKDFESYLAKRIYTWNSRDTDHQTTDELINYQYVIIPSSIKKVKNHNKEEQVERDFVLKRSKEVSQYLVKHCSSRQAAFVNNYDGKDNHCIAYFHFFIRDARLNLNVYVRSQNFDTNFIYDAQTFILAHQKMEKILKKHYNLWGGLIHVYTMSLHKVIK